MALSPAIHLRLPEDVREALRAEAESRGVPETEVAREYLAAALMAKLCRRCGGTGREL